MNEHISLQELAGEIREISRGRADRAEELVEGLLRSRLDGLSASEKQTVLEGLREQFRTSSGQSARGARPANADLLSDLFELFLGKRVPETELDSPEVGEALACALDTVSDRLRDVISTIGKTFGDEADPPPAMRHVISPDLGGETSSQPLQSRLLQIEASFLAANEAFKMAAQTEVEKILAELDPDQIASESGKGFGLGFMRRGDSFDVYRDRYEKVRKWFHSARFLEDLSREFERNCRRLTSENGGQGVDPP